MLKKCLCGITFSIVMMMAVCGFAQNFNISDLAGTWHAYIMETNQAAGTYWIYGSFTIDSSGNITGGTYKAPDGTTVAVTGGQVSLDNNGVMTGALTAEGGVTGLTVSLKAVKNLTGLKKQALINLIHHQLLNGTGGSNASTKATCISVNSVGYFRIRSLVYFSFCWIQRIR